jgi:hypothetical protein
VTPSVFDYNPATGRAVVVGPGPDVATLVVVDPAAVDPVVAIPLEGGRHLGASRPNPAGREAAIDFRLPRGGRVEIAVMDASGRRVAELLAGEREAGSHAIRWRPDRLAAGTYVAVLRLDGRVLDTRKITVAGQ